MAYGRFAFVLHGHIPYVLSHGRWPHGSDWLCEAAAETYLPLIELVERLLADKVRPKLTIGLSPVLCEQLTDQRFGLVFRDYLEEKRAAARHDRETFAAENRTDKHRLAIRWEDRYRRLREQFDTLNGDIVAAFRRLQDDGLIEIITCGATHAYFPLLGLDRTINAQTALAVDNYRRHFGRRPRGMWLPECGYRPRGHWRTPVEGPVQIPPGPRKGTDEFLAENGIEFFVVDSALLSPQRSAPGSMMYEGLQAVDDFDARFDFDYTTPSELAGHIPRRSYWVNSRPEHNRSVAVFVRDPETGILVWSGQYGYPGEAAYLEFHKKRDPGGHRYWAVTSASGDLGNKALYDPQLADERLEEHARHFVSKITDSLTRFYADTGESGILVAPYDAELFGHWWHEGPGFLERVLRAVAASDKVDLTFLAESLDHHPPRTTVSLPEGSWGLGNGHAVWLNDKTRSYWNFTHLAEIWTEGVVGRRHTTPEFRDGLGGELTRHMARELMLLAASDWPFLIATGSAKDYAEARIEGHFSAFWRLDRMLRELLETGSVNVEDRRWFDQSRSDDALFPDLDLRIFA